MKIAVDLKDWCPNPHLKPRPNPRYPRAELARLRLGLEYGALERKARKLMGWRQKDLEKFERWNRTRSSWNPVLQSPEEMTGDRRWYPGIQSGRRQVTFHEMLALACALGLDLNRMIADLDTDLPKAPPVTEDQVRRSAPSLRGRKARLGRARRHVAAAARRRFRTVQGGKG